MRKKAPTNKPIARRLGGIENAPHLKHSSIIRDGCDVSLLTHSTEDPLGDLLKKLQPRSNNKAIE